MENPKPLPSHIEEAMQVMAAMQAAHHDQASGSEKAIDRLTAFVARPPFVVYVGAVIAAWTAGNFLLWHMGAALADAPAYPLLGLAVACAALLIAILILVSQRRADRLANLRAQMTLEMSLLTTQKVSKLIDLMEELRRDSPNVRDRVDLQAEEMGGTPDHGTVLQALQEIPQSAPPAAAPSS